MKAIVHCEIDTLATAICSASTGGSPTQTVLHREGDETYVLWHKPNSVDLLLVLRKNYITKGEIKRISIDVESIDESSPPDIPAVVKHVSEKRRAMLSGSFKLSELQFEQTQIDWLASADALSSSDDENSVTRTFSNSDEGESSTYITSSRSTSTWSKLTVKKPTLTSLNIKKNANRIMRGKQFSTKHILRAFIRSLQRRFERPDEIDEKRRASFLEGLDSEPPLTVDEAEMIARVREKKKMIAVAKRLPHTLNNPVEKFLHEGENGELWGKSETMVHASCRTLFTHLWCIDTYDRTQTHRLANNNLPRVVWSNLNGTRSTQLSAIFKTVATLENRIINLWSTWERTVSSEGYETFFIAFDNIKERPGLNMDLNDYYNVGKAVEADVQGFFEIREIGKNLCVWTSFQSVDFNISLPIQILRPFARRQLKWAETISLKFRRSNRAVDREVRETFIEKMPCFTLTPAQKEICEKVEKELTHGSDHEGWQPLASSYRDLKLWARDIKLEKKAKRCIATGKAVGLVDASAEEVIAWYFDFCSLERLRVSIEEGNPARLKFNVEGFSNEIVAATIKSMPFPLTKREFVVRQICKPRNADGSISVICIDDKKSVDYGSNISTVRGSTMGIFTAKNVESRQEGLKQCEVTLFQKLDAGGFIPSAIMNSKLPNALSVVQDVIDEFRKDAEVDATTLKKMALIMEASEKQKYRPEENKHFEETMAFFDELDSKFVPLASPDPLVEMGAIFKDGDSSAIMKASCTVDATMDDIGSYEFSLETRSRKERYHKFGGVDRGLIRQSDHSQLYKVCYDFGFPGVLPREWVSHILWKKLDDKTMILVVVDADVDEFPKRSQYVRAKAKTLWKYEKLPEHSGVPQTRVTYLTQIGFNGIIPKVVANSRGIKLLYYLSNVRQRFDRGSEIDAMRRKVIVDSMDDEPFSSEEVSGVLTDDLPSKTNFGGSIQILSESGLLESLFLMGEVRGKGSLVTHDRVVAASLEDVAAYFWDVESRYRVGLGSNIEVLLSESPFKKNVVASYKIDSTNGAFDWIHSKRKFFNTMTMHFADDDSIVIFSKPSEQANGFDIKKKYERTVIKLDRVGRGTTKISLGFHLNLGGNVGKEVLKSILKTQERKLYYQCHQYFLARIPLKKMTQELGEQLGDILLSGIPKIEYGLSLNLTTRAQWAFATFESLKEAKERYPWIEVMVIEILKNKLNRHATQYEKIPAASLSSLGAQKIGQSLSYSLAASINAKSGVDEWIKQYRSTSDLDQEFAWFKSMVNVIALILLGRVSWGLKTRVYGAAFLSILDLCTDVYICAMFAKDGRDGLFRLTLGILATNIGLQTMICIVQNRSCGFKKLAKEVAFTASGLKLARDSFHVSSGHDKEEGQLMEPMLELTFTKGIELFAESIPSCIIQLFAIVTSSTSSIRFGAIGSIFVSAVTAGYTSATISYDLDTDPVRREIQPDFYGYIPDHATTRALVLLCLVGISACLLLVKSTVIVLLYMVGGRWLALYLGVDMGLYFLLKFAKRDFSYWMAEDNPYIHMLLSLLIRIVTKNIVDFTSIVQFRHPYEVGGLYWLFSLLVSLCSLPITGYVYQKSGQADESTMQFVWLLCTVLLPLAAFFFFGFFNLINQEYVSTFVSTITGRECTVNQFLDSKDDFVKADAVCNVNRNHLMGVIDDQVEEWIKNNWDTWIETKPKWFTNETKARMPTHMIPDEYDREEMEKLKERSSRRGSVAAVLGPVGNAMRQVGGLTKTGKEKVNPE